MTEFNTIACTASLHPHGHTQENEGPWSLRIGIQSQPMPVRRDTKQALLSIEQPNKDDNFTLLRVMFLKSGQRKPSCVGECTFHRARHYRRPGGVVEVRIKKRLGDSFPHPLPIGKYTGSCMYDADGGFAVFNLQARTLRKEAEPSQPRTIITPGDVAYNVALRDAKRTLSRVDGLGG